DRARHALAALRAGAESEVRAMVDAAIARLVADGTHDRALQLFEGVLAACARGELPHATVADLLQAAALAHATGNYALARARCLEAVALARTNGDAAGLADAALALGADLRPGSVDRVLVRALEEAQAALADRDEAHACRLAVRRAAAMQPATDRWAPVHVARAAIAQARTLGDAALLREVMLLAGAAMIDVVPHTETRALADELRELCEAAGDTTGLLRASARLVVDELTLGDLFAFDAHLDALVGLARSVGTPRLVWRPLLLASMRACMRGDIALSDRLTTEVEQLAALTDDPALAMSMPAHALTRAFALGRRSEADAMLAGLERYDVPNLEWLRLHVQMQYAHAFRDRAIAAQVVAAQGARLAVLCGPHGAVVGAVVALGGNAAQCREHADLLADEADHHIVEGHIPFAYCGSLRAVIAALEAGAGRRDVAERHYRDALAIADTHGLRPWAARIRLELGELVHDDELVRAAAEQADALGLHWLAGEARRSLAPERIATPTVRVGASLTMTRDGEVWRIAFGGRDVRIANARGLELLARLVERPSEEIHVLALAADAGAPAPESDAGELLDARAIESYRARLAKLAERIEDAHARADVERARRLAREQETLERELARAVGLGGRRRTAGSTSERARINVQRRLKDAIDRVERADAELGAYLRAAVRTGTYCTFRP
ncbi:MAG TPA: hypothetical protein VG755_24640, partial [Nannocystaceae bacterium]|nr:hypothetical protein [Nannocystaceae bacterium]